VIPDAGDCPDGPYPEPPQGASQVLYVLAGSTCVEGCGGIDTPFAEITTAVAAAPAWGAVLVGPGEYEGGIEVNKRVYLVGLCPAKVKIKGAGHIPSLAAVSGFSEAGIGVMSATGAKVWGVTIESPTLGLILLNADNFSVRDLELSSCGGIGFLAGNSNGLVQRLWVHDMKPDPALDLEGLGAWIAYGADVEIRDSGIDRAIGAGVLVSEDASLQVLDSVIRLTDPDAAGGQGVVVEGGSTATLTRVVAEDNARFGISADGKGAVLDVHASVIRDTQLEPSGVVGNGIRVLGGGTLNMSESVVSGNHGAGISMGPGSATITNSAIRETAPDEMDGQAAGVVAVGAAEVSISGCSIHSNITSGVTVSGASADLTIVGSAIRSGAAQPSGQDFAEVAVGAGATVRLSSCVVEHRRWAAIAAVGAGAGAELNRTSVRALLDVPDKSAGRGLEAGSGGSLTVLDSLVENNRDCGVCVQDEGATALLEGVVVRDNLPLPDGNRGEGVLVNAGGFASLWQCVVENNSYAGIVVQNSDAEAHLEEVVIRGSVPNGSEPGFGIGLHVVSQSRATMHACLLEDNQYAALSVAEEGGEATVTDTVVRDTGTAGAGDYGHGIYALDGASVAVESCVIRNNRSAGVAAFLPGTVVEVSGSVLAETAPTEAGDFGVGAHASQGASLTVTGTLIEGNAGAGASAALEGTTVTLGSSVIRGDPKGFSSRGVHVEGGATLELSDCMVEGNLEAGAVALDPLTSLALTRVVVRETLPGEQGGSGAGVQVEGGAAVTVRDSLLARNRAAGVALFDDGSSIHLLRSAVLDTQPLADGDYGAGVVAQQGAECVVERTLLARNSTAGVMVYDAGSSSTLHQSVVTDTFGGGGLTRASEDPAESQVFGDGGVAAAGGRLDLVDSIVTANSRCGLYYHQSPGEVTGSRVLFNGSFGLAMSDAAQLVSHENSDNVIAHNAHALPHSLRREITDSPEGLPVPPPPKTPSLASP